MRATTVLHVLALVAASQAQAAQSASPDGAPERPEVLPFAQSAPGRTDIQDTDLERAVRSTSKRS